MTANEDRARERRKVGSVSRALMIIELLAERESQDVSVSETARALGIGRSTAHQLLTTLTAHGFAEQCEDSPRYRLGPRLMRAGAVAAAGLGLGPAAISVLEELVREVGETSSIGVLAMDEVVLLHRVEARSVLRVDLRVGTRLPLLTSAIGQVILGALPNAESESRIRQLAGTAEETENAMERIKFARTNGYAIVHGTPVEGINAIAAPIVGANGSPIAGLVVAGPNSRFAPDSCKAAVLARARQISAFARV